MAGCPYSLSFYLHRPPDGITLRELEDASLKRMQLLRALELPLEDKGTEAQFNVMLADKNAGLFYAPSQVVQGEERMRGEERVHMKDEASHYLVKLACCATSEMAKWFVRLETQLLMRRLESYLATPTEINNFLRTTLGLYYTESPEGFYRVPLAQCTHLLLPHNLHPVKGFVNVPITLVAKLVGKMFEELLEYSVENVQGNLPLLEEDDRLEALVRKLRNPGSTSISRPAEAKAKLPLEQVDAASRHFPPCMKVLYQYLRKEHHLKHYGRLQFTLFLKTVGMPFEDAIKFWKGEFCQKITPDKFHKDYEYNIRHSYGKVGKMVDYTSQGCSKLVHMPQPSAQEHHGCPFRHMGKDDLAKVLLSYGLNPLELNPILEKAELHQQVACIRLFKTVHKMTGDAGTEHVGHYPAAFYEASKRMEMQ